MKKNYWNCWRKFWTYFTGTIFSLFFCGFLANAQYCDDISYWKDGISTNWSNAGDCLTPYKLIKDNYRLDQTDDQFTMGSKDYLPFLQNRWSDGQTKNKNDLANAASGLLKIGNQTYLCFAGDRARVQGDAQIGFWLFWNGTSPVPDIPGGNKGYFTPEHRARTSTEVGDLLIIADFSNGGRMAKVKVYEWVGSGGSDGTLDNVTLTIGDAVVAQNNTGETVIPVGWQYDGSTYKKNAFYEGYINITQIINDAVSLSPFCQATFMLECRSSNELNSSLDDFARGKFADEIPCAITGPETVCPKDEITFCGPVGPYTYDWSISEGLIVKKDDNCVHVQAPNHCGVFVIKLTVKDVLGCEKTCEKEFKVVDSEFPVYKDCPSAVVELGCNPDPIKYACTLNLDNWSDNCRINSAGIIDGIAKPDPVGCGWSVTHITYAIDYCGNKSTCVQTFHWKVDLDPPVIKADGTGGNLECNPSAEAIEAALGKAAAWDKCNGNVRVVVMDEKGNQGCWFWNNRTFNATDSCGNKAKPVTIYVKWKVDLDKPVITAYGKGGYLDCNPSEAAIEVALGKATAWDNCDEYVTVNASDEMGGQGCYFWKSRTFHAKDKCGNLADPVTIYVKWKFDQDRPLITTYGKGGYLDCNPSVEAIEVALGKATAWDGCDGDITPAIVVNTGTAVNTEGCKWSQTRTFDVTDKCGNPAIQKSVTVTWKVDIEPPVLQDYSNLVFACGQEQKIPVPVFNDNCDGIVPFGCEVTGYPGADCFNFQYPVGVTEICFTAKDLCGNPSKKCFTVTVNPCPCETAFATLENENALCFIPDFSRWGWTNEINAEGTYKLKLYASAAHCLGGDLVGEVKVVYAGSKVSVAYTPYAGYSFKSTNVYVGIDPYPSINGVPTVAPGQYTYDPEATYTGKVYVIAHADVCEMKSAPVPGGDPGANSLMVYPNPFNRFVAFEFVSERDAQAVLEIHNVLGQKVATLMNKQVEKGVLNRVDYIPRGQESGIFFYRLMLDNSVMKGKIIYTK